MDMLLSLFVSPALPSHHPPPSALTAFALLFVDSLDRLSFLLHSGDTLFAPSSPPFALPFRGISPIKFFVFDYFFCSASLLSFAPELPSLQSVSSLPSSTFVLLLTVAYCRLHLGRYSHSVLLQLETLRKNIFPRGSTQRLALESGCQC